MRFVHVGMALALVGGLALGSAACGGGGGSGGGGSSGGSGSGGAGAGASGSSAGGAGTGSSETAPGSGSGTANAGGGAGGTEGAGGAGGAGTEGTASGGGAAGGAGAGGDAGATATATASEPPAPDVPMHVQSLTSATGWFRGIDIERRDDGTLLFRGQPVGRMTGGRIISVDGQPVPLTGRLSIGVRGRREHMEIQPDGSIRMDGGTLTIGPQGDVLIAHRAGGPTQPVHVQITGFSAAAVRTADILLAYGIMRADLASR